MNGVEIALTVILSICGILFIVFGTLNIISKERAARRSQIKRQLEGKDDDDDKTANY